MVSVIQAESQDQFRALCCYSLADAPASRNFSLIELLQIFRLNHNRDSFDRLGSGLINFYIPPGNEKRDVVYSDWGGGLECRAHVNPSVVEQNQTVFPGPARHSANE